MNVGTLICGLVLLVGAATATAQDYVLTVNGQETELDLEQPATLQLADGTTLQIQLRQKEFLRYKQELFSFEHKNNFRPNTTDLAEGVEQTMLVTPLGTGLIVQTYDGPLPEGMADLMLQQLTGEEAAVGYDIRVRESTKKVDGVTLKGKDSISSKDDESWRRSVWTYSNGEQSILVITFVEKDNFQADRQLIDKFWESFEVADSLK